MSLGLIARPHFDEDQRAWLTETSSRRAGSRGPPYFTVVFLGPRWGLKGSWPGSTLEDRAR